MVETNLVKALRHENPDIRKQAIMRLAKSCDREALPYLAQVYKTDEDKAIRELARKGGVYIQQNAVEVDTFADADDGYDAYDDIYDEADGDDILETDLEKVQVSSTARERAKAAIDSAMDMSVKGREDRAFKLAQKALKLDPHLALDSYTRNLLSRITGLPGEEAVRALQTDQVAVESQGVNHRPFAGGMLLGALIIAAAFFLTWLDFGGAFGMDDFGGGESEVYSGLDISTNKDNIAIALSQVEQILQLMDGASPSLLTTSRNLTTFSPFLIPAVAFVAFFAGFTAIFNDDPPGGYFWLQGVGLGILALVPVGWLYVTMNDFFDILGGFLLGGNAFDAMGIGFWITVLGAVVMAASSVAGMILVTDES